MYFKRHTDKWLYSNPFLCPFVFLSTLVQQTIQLFTNLWHSTISNNPCSPFYARSSRNEHHLWYVTFGAAAAAQGAALVPAAGRGSTAQGPWEPVCVPQGSAREMAKYLSSPPSRASAPNPCNCSLLGGNQLTGSWTHTRCLACL